MPRIMTETLVTHTMIAIPITSLLFLQMAMLEALFSFVWERRPEIARTEEDAHTKNNQEGSGDKAQVARELENRDDCPLL